MIKLILFIAFDTNGKYYTDLKKKRVTKTYQIEF